MKVCISRNIKLIHERKKSYDVDYDENYNLLYIYLYI